jgi:hypothetical protein
LGRWGFNSYFWVLIARSAVLSFRPSERGRYAAKSKTDHGEHKDGVHRHRFLRARAGGSTSCARVVKVSRLPKKMRRAKTSFALANDRLPAAAPTASPAVSPSASPPAAATNELDNQQQHQRANRGVDDRSNNAQTKMDAELRQQPPANEGSYDSDNEVADESKAGALHDLAGEPSCNESDYQYDKETFT